MDSLMLISTILTTALFAGAAMIPARARQTGGR